MTKRRKKLSLFEAMADDADGAFKTPDWAKPGAAAKPAERTQPSLKQAPGINLTAPRQEAPELPRLTAPEHREPPRPSAPAAASGALQVRLSYATCVAICLGLVVLLAGAYTLGRRSASGAGEQAEASAGPIAGDATGGDAYDFDAAQAEAMRLYPSGERVLIIQDHVESIDEAKTMQRFLRSRGYTPLVHTEGSRIAIVSTRDVGRMSEAELQASIRALKTLGRDPRWELKDKYDFSAAYVHTSRP